MMFDIYAEAYLTIVLSADLMPFSASDMLYLEPAMRIITSSWMRRLWTFQEGAMSRNLYFLLADGLKNIEDLELQYPRAASESVIASTARLFYTSLLRPRASAANRKVNEGLVSSVYRAIQWRTTSRMEDERLAIARVLNVYESEVLANPADLRVKTLLRKVPEIPSGLIFMPGARLKNSQFRWAPTTLDGMKAPASLDPLTLSERSLLPSKWSMSMVHSVLTDRGLLVHYPGFRLHRDAQESKSIQGLSLNLSEDQCPVNASLHVSFQDACGFSGSNEQFEHHGRRDQRYQSWH